MKENLDCPQKIAENCSETQSINSPMGPTSFPGGGKIRDRGNEAATGPNNLTLFILQLVCQRDSLNKKMTDSFCLG